MRNSCALFCLPCTSAGSRLVCQPLRYVQSSPRVCAQTKCSVKAGEHPFDSFRMTRRVQVNAPGHASLAHHIGVPAVCLESPCSCYSEDSHPMIPTRDRYQPTFLFRRTRWKACVAGVIVSAFATAAELQVDFARSHRAWDGFGANYVETRHTRDYNVFAQDYGGFKYLDEPGRQRVIDLVFGDDGLRVGLLKVFADPFHERENDNDDPLIADSSKFDHTTTTRWIRYFARHGLEKTRARGDELKVLVGLYGPPGWMTRQGSLLGRDLKPGYAAEVAEYLAVFPGICAMSKACPSNMSPCTTKVKRISAGGTMGWMPPVTTTGIIICGGRTIRLSSFYKRPGRCSMPMASPRWD